MELGLIIITSLVLLFQFLLDFFTKSPNTKKIIGLIILIFGLSSVCAIYFLQEKDKNDAEITHASEINDQKDQFNKLDIELKLRNEDLKAIKQQNDSLKIQLFKLNEKQEEFFIISEISAQEVSKSRVALENMGYKQISRGISQIDKVRMIDILKKYKGSKVKIIVNFGDDEALQFAYQIKEVFIDAGWVTENIPQRMYTKPMKGIFIITKSKKYPPRANSIFDSFIVLNMIAQGEMNTNLNDNEIELLIGTK